MSLSNSLFFRIPGAKGLRLLLVCCLLLQEVPVVQAQYGDGEATYTDFYTGLAPYGQWIEDARFGFLWAPDVEEDFRPYYTNGRWVMTEAGNTWLSDYVWGWACFHYGRWIYNDFYGWLWQPGSYWGPAWVDWQASPNLYGWAPLTPEAVIDHDGVRDACPEDWWVFVPSNNIYTGNYQRYRVGTAPADGVASMLKYVNRVTLYRDVACVEGPHINEVKKTTGEDVLLYKLRSGTSRNIRIHNDELRMFKPTFVRPVFKSGDNLNTPAGFITAPDEVVPPQPVGAQSVPPFWVSLRQKKAPPVPGTAINKTAEPTPAGDGKSNPYEWDVTRPAKQENHPVAPRKKQLLPARGKLPPAKAAPKTRQSPARESAMPAKAGAAAHK